MKVNLKNEIISNFAKKNYKGWVAAQKNYATEAVQDYAAAKKVMPTVGVSGSVPIFSASGFKYISMLVKNALRKKTPDEKILSGARKFDKVAEGVDALENFIKNSFESKLADNFERKMFRLIYDQSGLEAAIRAFKR